jgi:hypothetical protein
MSGICNGDWMRLRCGDRVHITDDPRHIGRIEAIHHGAYARVRWDENVVGKRGADRRSR